MDNFNEKKYSFPQKVWIIGGIFSFIVVILLLLKTTFNVWLLILAGSLIAVLFKGISGLLQKKTKWKEKITLPIAIIGSLLLFGLVSALIGTKVQTQAEQLKETLPATVQKAKDYLNKSPLGQKVIEKVSSPEAKEKAQKIAQSFFQTTFGVFGDIYVILFLGIFFTVGSRDYKNGFVALVPKQHKEEAAAVLDKTGVNLKKWLKGQLLAMFVVFALTATGLAIIGVPLWLVLAIIAGILNFIPNFGPMIAMVPAVLVGLLQSPGTAATVAGLYIIVQVVESNFITPMVQKKLLDTPPAMIIVAQLVMTALTGGWGIILAIPFFVIVMTLVQELYIKKQ